MRMAGQIVEPVHNITREVRIAGQQPRIGIQAGSLYVVIARIASVLGAVVPIYHLDGITQDLRFTPEALAEICLGKIRRWNDPEIQRSSRGIALPDAAIAVVHRSDGSGTP